MTGFNISSLFGGFGVGSGFGSINFSDYAAIRNGSYRRMLKTYYAQQKNTQTERNDRTAARNKTAGWDDYNDSTGLKRMRTEASSLKSAAEACGKSDLWKSTDGKYNTDKITSAIKDFAKKYNNTLEQEEKVSSKDVSRQTGFMKSMTNTMSDALSKVGVTVGSDGKLSVDEEKLKSADMNNVKSLFSGSYSYASQIAGKAGGIASAALRNTGLYSNTGSWANSAYGSYNWWT